jgi:lysophospholipase L1-like esterase
MAFGNSITEGKTATGQTPNNYPVQLRALLAARYTAQASAIVVANHGLGGETANEGAARLGRVMNAANPEVLLLEEGINNLSSGLPSSIPPMINALQDMVREAARRIGPRRVFLANLPPVREGSPKTAAASILPAANLRIRQLADQEGVIYVDLYGAFGGTASVQFIDTDGLHPTPAGYGRIAETFFQSIRTELEVATMPVSLELVRNMPMPQPPIASAR